MRRKSLTAAAVVLSLTAAGALADAVPKEELDEQAYRAEQVRIVAEHAADRRACRQLRGHARDLCKVQAEGKASSRQAWLEARHQPDPDRTYDARLVTAKAHYDIARVKCKALDGDARKRCVRQAKAAREAAERHAAVEKVEETGGIFARKGS